MASKAARTGKKTPADGDKRLGRDERVSFYPMKGDDVLRKLLRTPPPGRLQDKPTSDKGEKK